MKLESIPFDGLFIVYKRMNNEMQRLFCGFSVDDIPTEYKSANVTRVYPVNDSIIVEI